MGHVERGRGAELQAAEYLKNKGFTIVARNFRKVGAEVDLVVTKAQSLFFVEVKARWSSQQGEAIEQVPLYKQRRLARVAEAYLLERPLAPNEQAYFAVLAIDYQGQGPQYTWVPDAFDNFS